MEICEVEKSSFIDYPDKISTVIFVKGCNFRCPYCHNSHILENSKKQIDQKELFKFLDKRKKFIDAVTITGGEPTLYSELYEFINELKDRGFFIKLDTNGTNPKMINKLLKDNLLDYIAMDIKAPLDRYSDVTKSLVDINKITESVNLIKKSSIDYEFRTTVCKELIDLDEILTIGNYIKGSKKYILQNFRDGDTVLDSKNQFHSFDLTELDRIKNELKDLFGECKVR